MPVRLRVAATACLLIGIVVNSGRAAAPPFNAERSIYSIRWASDTSNTNKVAVEVVGLRRTTLQELRQTNWTKAQWQRLLSVYAEQGDLMVDVGLPAMAGEYRVNSGSLRFQPQFALEPGTRYRAVFSPDHLPGKSGPAKLITSTFHIPDRQAIPTTVVSNVFPSAAVLPENLLKFYLHFSAPMSGGHIYDHIHLRDETGKDVDLPFLEIDEELWNPTMTRLTLFIDPGRIKRGVKPLEDVGPALEKGKRYTLVIHETWKDAANVPLKQSFQKHFKVGAPDREPVDPARWKIQSPKSETLEPLIITFPEPLDHALALRVIRVMDASDQSIEGAAALENEERRWTFTPVRAWRRGPHTVLVQTTIEDLAGNNIGKSFEVDLFEGVQRQFTNATVKLPLVVR